MARFDRGRPMTPFERTIADTFDDIAVREIW